MLFRSAAPFGLAVRELPLALPTFDVNVFWHPRAHQEAASRWLRERMAQLFANARQ